MGRGDKQGIRAGFGPSNNWAEQVWAEQDLGRAGFGPSRIWAKQKLGRAGFGPSKIWTKQNLGRARFGPKVVSSFLKGRDLISSEKIKISC